MDDELLEKAQDYLGFSEKTAIVREALHALIQRESARRLANLGGSSPDLKPIPRPRNEEVRQLIKRQSLFRRGIGFVDVPLLASVLLTSHTQLWTRDRRLRVVAE